MSASTKDQAKKRRERFFVQRFLESVPQPWQIVEDREVPDFVMRDGAGEFGLEVAEVFKDRRRSRAGAALESPGRSLEAQRLHYLRELAAEYYLRGGRPLHVQALLPRRFALPSPELVLPHLLADRPAEPMARARIEIEPCATFFLCALPDDWQRYSRWVAVDNSVGLRRQSRLEDLQTLVDQKATRLADYREVRARVELLLFADGTKSSGMISWQEDFAPLDAGGFDAVWLYVHPREAWCVSARSAPAVDRSQQEGR